MRSILKKIIFSANRPNRILSGVSSGMITNYDPGNRSLHLLGLYEREIYPYLLKGIKGADTLIDIGANDGYYGLAFAKHKGKRILLCEPGGPEIKDLLKNMEMNGLLPARDFELIDKFISNKTSETEVSINSLVKNESKIFILMDVDGGELSIIEDFDFTRKVNVDWLIETHSLELERGVSDVLKRQGYEIKIIDAAWWRKFIPERRPLEHNRWLFASKNGL